MRSERQFQTEVIKYLKSRGCYVYKNAQSQYTEVGRPDLTACVPVNIAGLKIGMFFGIELKREDKYNTASTAQEITGRKIEEAGGRFYVIDNLQDLKDIIERLQDGL